MANAFANTAYVSTEILRLLTNKLVIAEMFNTNWNDEFRKDFAVGTSVTLKKPQRFIARDGMGYSAQDFERQTVTINLDQVFGVDFEWDSFERLVYLERSEEELRRNYLEPAANELFQQLESRAAQFAYLNTPNVFGALGTNPTTVTPFLDADARLFDKSAPFDREHRVVISSKMMASFLGNQTVQFNPSSEIAQQYKKGVVGMHAGLEWARSPSLYRHTAGTWAGAVTVNSAGQSGSSLTLACTTGDTFMRGDHFSILNVNFTNPNTRRVAGANQVQHFVVTQNVTGAASTATIPIYPAIVGPGSPYQNVDALPASGAALTLWPGTSSPNGKAGAVGLVLTNQAFALAWGKFENPKAVERAEQTRDPQTGANIAFVRQFDIQERKMKNRFDMCVGFGVLYADECAALVVGA